MKSSLARVLIGANILLLSAVGVLLVSGFTGRAPERVLSLERLNIVDSAGKPVLVLANGKLLPGGVFSGKEYPQSFSGRGRIGGMLFYNPEGDEVGGLVYDGAKTDSGYSAVGHLSFDQWKQNQVVAMTYSDNGKSRMAGIRVWDRPSDAPLAEQFEAAAHQLAATGAVKDSLAKVTAAARARVAGIQRVFVGSVNRTASIELRDTTGAVRAKMYVDSSGVSRLQFLDSKGKVVASYPPQDR
jgi:hypothetical protein